MLTSKYFVWIIENKIGGMPHPEVFGNLAENLDNLRKNHKIGIIINLTERPIDEYELKQRDILYFHIPIEDFTAPTMDQLLHFKDIYESAQNPIAVHCYAGMGRTGTILAAALVIEGSTPENAIISVRAKRPGSIENDEQKESIFKFYEVLNNKK